MADVVATAPLAKAADRLRELLSAESDFQTWCGESTQAAAKGHIHLGMLTDTEIAALDWPYIQVYSDDESGSDAKVAVDTFMSEPGLMIIVGGETPATHANSGRNAWVYAENDLHTISALLRTINGGEHDGYRLVHQGVEIVERPVFVARSENSDTDRFEAFNYQLRLRLGPEPGEE